MVRLRVNAGMMKVCGFSGDAKVGIATAAMEPANSSVIARGRRHEVERRGRASRSRVDLNIGYHVRRGEGMYNVKTTKADSKERVRGWGKVGSSCKGRGDGKVN